MIANRLSKIHDHRHRLNHQIQVDRQSNLSTTRSNRPHQPIRAIQTHQAEGREDKLAAAELQRTALTEVHHVSQRKYNIDAGSPWWKRAFFRYVYLPFNRFAFTRLGIPALDEVEINGKKLTFCWYEDEGVFEDADAAEAACLGEFWRVKRMDFNRVYPPETAQRSGHRYPRAKKPDRYLKPTFDLSVVNRKEQEAIRSEIARLNKILDQ